MKNQKVIFVIGGVMSSIGKGIVTASVAQLLQSKGFRVTAMKIDPYVNIDAGTMNPTQHGEVFVTIDGDETDQDLGNYERFLNQNITSLNYMTTGRVYQSVITRERNLEYDGKCVQVVPHVPEEVIRRIQRCQRKTKAEVTVIEVGGTVGEYENILFLEAARMMHLRNPDDVAFILVSYLPIPAKVGEMKTKPTQHASRTLNSAGIQADFIVARSETVLDKPRRERLGIFCNINKRHAISAPDVDSIYEVPVLFDKQHFGDYLTERLKLPTRKTKMQEWKTLVEKRMRLRHDVNIGVVGKYFGTGNFTLADSYVSVIEALKHASWAANVRANLTWIDSEDFEKNPGALKNLSQYDGIIVPGGFGKRGIKGILSAIQYVRENKIPYLGLCYGMQLATIEFARNVVKIADANTVEIDPKTKNPIIHINEKQARNVAKKNMGGSMRLGSYQCALVKDSLSAKAYKTLRISERHRHRYEFNNDYKERLEKKGMRFAGINKKDDLVEIIELKNHPWFVGVQFHPEFQSRPLSPHPLFRDFISAAKRKQKTAVGGKGIRVKG